MPIDRVTDSVEDLHPTIPAIVGLPLLLILTVFSVQYACGALAYQAIAEWRLHRQLCAIGRFRPWYALLDELDAAHGTLIVEQANKRGYRIWWTPECVRALSPHGVVIPADIDYLGVRQVPSFFQWCFENYCSPSTGRAILTRCPMRFSAGFIQQDTFAAKFPRLDVVLTVMQK